MFRHHLIPYQGVNDVDNQDKQGTDHSSRKQLIAPKLANEETAEIQDHNQRYALNDKYPCLHVEVHNFLRVLI